MNALPAENSVGFIGLGSMGGEMARHLVEAGLPLIVADVNNAAVERLVALGAVRASGPKEVADRARTVFVSLPTPAIVDEVSQEIAASEAMRLYIDLSTTGPTVAVRVAQRLNQRGIACLDAPVSGGAMGAKNATLAIMASGPRAAYDAAEPLLKHLGKNVFHVGEDIGQGQVLKLANNMVGAIAIVATAEGLAMCVKAGIDPTRALEVFNAGTARSVATEVTIPRAVVSGAYNFGFRLELMNKDLRLCLQEAEALGTPMLLGAMNGQIWNFAMAQGMGSQDFTTIAKLVAQWAKVDLTAPPAT